MMKDRTHIVSFWLENHQDKMCLIYTFQIQKSELGKSLKENLFRIAMFGLNQYMPIVYFIILTQYSVWYPKL